MKKNNKLKKFIYLVLLFFFVLSFQTIVYSAINATLTVKGDAYARSEADVRITGFRLATTNNATSSFEEYGKNHIITEVELKDSSSSITYYVEITNYGSEDVGIFDITGLPSGVNYTIKDYNLKDKICDDSGKCNSFIKKNYELTLTTTSTYTGSIQMNFDFRIFHKVTYTGIENKGYPTDVIDGGNLIISFKEDLERVQVLSNNNQLAYYKTISNGSSINVSNIPGDVLVKQKPYVAKLMSGSLDEVGSEICIENECFNIISNNGVYISMLAKYNLYTGYECASSDLTSCTPYGEEATGIQNSTMLGKIDDTTFPKKGVIKFADSPYWSDTASSSKIDVFNSKTFFYNDVMNYKNKLEQMGADILAARLLSYYEYQSVYNSFDWIYNTSFWLGTSYQVVEADDGTLKGQVYGSLVNGGFGGGTIENINNLGVRPVIDIPVDEIGIVRTVSGDYDTVGSEVCISDECFYVMSSTDDTVTMLAKYNLYVGAKYDPTKSSDKLTYYGDEATGKQDSKMLGVDVATQNTQVREGVDIFSTSNYWDDGSLKSQYGPSYPAYVYDSNSSIYPYVENYKTYLGSVGVNLAEARLINYQELLNLGCPDAFTYEDANAVYCKDGGAPGWLYSTSYWTGISPEKDYIYRISNSSAFNLAHYPTVNNFGVRPVITIEKPKV